MENINFIKLTESVMIAQLRLGCICRGRYTHRSLSFILPFSLPLPPINSVLWRNIVATSNLKNPRCRMWLCVANQKHRRANPVTGTIFLRDTNTIAGYTMLLLAVHEVTHGNGQLSLSPLFYINFFSPKVINQFSKCPLALSLQSLLILPGLSQVSPFASSLL